MPTNAFADPNLCDTYAVITLVATQITFRLVVTFGIVVIVVRRCNSSSIEAVAMLLLSTWLERRRQTILTRRKIYAFNLSSNVDPKQLLS